MLAIKLRPVGKKKQISYRIVVDQKHSKLKGRFVEDLGWYNPHTNLFKVNADRVRYWMHSGAQPTDSVHNILISAHVLEGNKIPVHGKSKHAPEASVQEQPKPTQESSPTPDVAVETPEESSVEEPAQETPAEASVVESADSEESSEATPAQE